jgi:hypothetical protein
MQFKKAGMGVQRDAPKPYASVPTRVNTCTVAMAKSDLAKTNYENQKQPKDSLTLKKNVLYVQSRTLILFYNCPILFRRCGYPKNTA